MKLEIVDGDGDKLDIGEVFHMGDKNAALFVTAAADPNDIEGVNLSLENAEKLRDWLSAFIDTAEPAVTWLKTPPSADGLYWWRRDRDEEPEMIVLYKLSTGAWWAGTGLLTDCGGEWWPTPIEVPPQ